jgi:hypothetical protein
MLHQLPHGRNFPENKFRKQIKVRRIIDANTCCAALSVAATKIDRRFHRISGALGQGRLLCLKNILNTAAALPAGQENKIEFHKPQPNPRPPIYRVVDAVPHAEMERNCRQLGRGKTAGNVRRQARQEAAYGVARHGG